jgi:hypothetical protein
MSTAVHIVSKHHLRLNDEHQCFSPSWASCLLVSPEASSCVCCTRHVWGLSMGVALHNTRGISQNCHWILFIVVTPLQVFWLGDFQKVAE